MDSTPLSPRLARFLPWLMATAFFMQGLDATIVNVALPSMAQSLQQNPLQMQSVIIAYLLTVAALIPVSGWIAERYGTRRVFAGAIVLFTIGSLLCGISGSLVFLVISRILQGIGGALMVPVGRLVILRSYPREQLVKVMGFVTLPALLGPLVGPTLGGWLVQALSWHWIFLINIPIGIVGCYFAGKFTPNFQREEHQHFDLLGFVLFSGAMVAISMSLEGLADLHMGSVPVVLLLLVGCALLCIYWLRAISIEEPLFSPSLFKIRTFTVGILGNIFARLGNGALPFLIPLKLQVGLGYSPIKTGLTMIPLTLAAMAAKPIVQPILTRLGYRRTLVINTVLLGIMIMGLGFISSSTPEVIILIQLAILGLINSLQFTSMNTLTLIDLKEDNAAGGNSMLAVVMQLSIGMGVASSAALLDGFSGSISPDNTQIMHAFFATFLCVGGIAILAAFIFFQLHAGDGRVRARKKKTA
ncbi:putative transport protein HsrA [Halomonadaceae bacterium LMG 33818]|uniref:multidrug transporter subunit MdtD n=1 Tax=Cernens ardua TaxID=3402176 RepID=UPI003EDC6CEB